MSSSVSAQQNRLQAMPRPGKCEPSPAAADAGVGRVERLRRKLGGCEVRPFAPLPPRRRGRSRTYHDKLVAQILDEEAKLIGHLQTVTHKLERRIRIRKARGEW
jgi:hypothetical protein